LAPVVELDLEEIRPELVQQLSVELEAHVRPRATVLADASEAGRTLEVANVRRFDVELDRPAAESRPSPPHLQPSEVEVGDSPERVARTGEGRHAQEHPDGHQPVRFGEQAGAEAGEDRTRSRCASAREPAIPRPASELQTRSWHDVLPRG